MKWYSSSRMGKQRNFLIWQIQFKNKSINSFQTAKHTSVNLTEDAFKVTDRAMGRDINCMCRVFKVFHYRAAYLYQWCRYLNALIWEIIFTKRKYTTNRSSDILKSVTLCYLHWRSRETRNLIVLPTLMSHS